MKNKYLFFKHLFPNCILLFKSKNTYKSYKQDLYILKYIHFQSLKDLKKKQINFIVIDGVKIYFKKWQRGQDG